MLWRILRRTNPLLLAVMIGCASTHPIVRVETEQGTAIIHIPRTEEVQPVALEEEEVQQSLRTLARQVRLTGTPLSHSRPTETQLPQSPAPEKRRARNRWGVTPTIPGP
jgi:hypothetical protein